MSKMLVLDGHAPDSAVTLELSATFPVAVVMTMVPDASGAGKSCVPPLP
jgi:hypothetical protein